MLENLSPIVLFVFNRPIHTQNTLNALKNAIYANKSNLYIYCDIPKSGSSKKSYIDNLEVINIIKNIKGFKSVNINIRNLNFGLSKNILCGVEEVLKISNKVIVLEDDMLVSKYFLKYMNEGLIKYEHIDKVACIHAWKFSFIKVYNKSETFFLPGGDCWGWATWDTSWRLFQKNSFILLIKLLLKNKIFTFNRNNTEDYIDLLINNIFNLNDSWAIRWHASLILKDKLCLYPKHSLIYNTGLDGSGQNCNDTNLKQDFINLPINIQDIDLIDSPWYYEQLKVQNNQYKKLPILCKILKSLYLVLRKSLKSHINL
jgi:hypothetical protein